MGNEERIIEVDALEDSFEESAFEMATYAGIDVGYRGDFSPDSTFSYGEVWV